MAPPILPLFSNNKHPTLSSESIASSSITSSESITLSHLIAAPDFITTSRTNPLNCHIRPGDYCDTSFHITLYDNTFPADTKAPIPYQFHIEDRVPAQQLETPDRKMFPQWLIALGTWLWKLGTWLCKLIRWFWPKERTHAPVPDDDSNDEAQPNTANHLNDGEVRVELFRILYSYRKVVVVCLVICFAIGWLWYSTGPGFWKEVVHSLTGGKFRQDMPDA